MMRERGREEEEEDEEGNEKSGGGGEREGGREKGKNVRSVLAYGK